MAGCWGREMAGVQAAPGSAEVPTMKGEVKLLQSR